MAPLTFAFQVYVSVGIHMRSYWCTSGASLISKLKDSNGTSTSDPTDQFITMVSDQFITMEQNIGIASL